MWLVTIYPDADRDAFIQWMKDNGFEFKEFEFIPRVFEVEETFDHSAIQMIEGSEWKTTRPAARQEINVNLDLMSGPDNWALARTIRRDIPWIFDKSFTGIKSFFEAGLDGTGVDIYVIDSGFNATHDEFGGRGTNVANYAGGSNFDSFGHGTACGSLCGGLKVGTARGALLWSFRCFDSTGGGATTWTVNAVNGAISHYNGRSALNRAAVMNLSLESTSASTKAAVEAAVVAGIVVVAAAGNDNIDCAAVYPAAADGVICVGGYNSHDGSYYFTADGTNWGAQVDVLAPGYGIRVADHTGNSNYKSGRGTSYSCAVTTGVVACLLTGKQRLTEAQVAIVRQYVIDSATTGRFKGGPTIGALPDRLLYLDPTLVTSPITFVG